MRYAVVITHKVENGRALVHYFNSLDAARAHATDSTSDKWNAAVIDTQATQPNNRIK
jgi:hypothetical protein